MAERNERFDVAIAGGSFVGLAQALALASADADIRVAVIDRTPPEEAGMARSDGRATALSAASRQLFDILGVWDDVADAAQPIVDIDITDSSLDTLVRPRLLHFDTELRPGEAAAWMVENHILRRALIARANAQAGIRFLAPETVTGFANDDGGVTLALAGGSDLSAALLVVADGRKSALRKAAGIKTIGWSYPQIGIVATVAHEKPHDGVAIQHFLPAGPFAILPLTGNRASLVWTEEAARGREIVALDDARFLAELKPRFGTRFGAVSLAGPRGAFPLDLHIARSFIAERVALVGDAAHGVHPLAGQGLNIGLRDVAALTQVLVDARRLGLDAVGWQALRRYEQWRRFDSAFSGLAMDALNRLFSNDNTPLRALRSLGLGLVDRAPALKRFFVHEAAGMTGEVPLLLKGELP
ncbi:MAG: FAD-dependent monooxygenase [Hyphomicrobiales bacterium]|nr:FAD-dependent monooxygenase [Hyphomicrobiales bacterium]